MDNNPGFGSDGDRIPSPKDAPGMDRGVVRPLSSGSAISQAEAAASKGSSSSIKKLGGFLLIEKVGAGAMGAVFKARQISLDRDVALKVLLPSIAKDKKFIERFQREARSSAALNHPNIVQGIDVGKDVDTGLWYFAMEFVDGPSLRELLAQKRVLEEGRVISIGRDIAKALECAERNGIVHRDIKPDNILIGARNETKLADLGLARHVDSESQDASRTQDGLAVGTPHYMSPEQAAGKLEMVDIRSDIYSLGATLYHLLTGRTPFDGGTSAEVMAKHLKQDPPLAHQILPSVGEKISRLVARMMAKQRGQRVQSASDLVRAFDRLMEADRTTGPRMLIRGMGTTGPRGAVFPKTTGSPNSMGDHPLPARVVATNGYQPGPGGRAAIGVMMAAGILVVGLIAILFMGGGDQEIKPKNPAKSEMRLHESAQSASHEDVEPAILVQWRELRMYEDSHPRDFTALFERYRTFERGIPGSGLSDEKKREYENGLKALRDRFAEAADRRFQEILFDSEAMIKTRRYDDALRALNQIDHGFKPFLDDRLNARMSELNQEAEAEVGRAIESGQALMRDGLTADSFARWSKGLQIQYEKGQGRLENIRRELSAALPRLEDLTVARAFKKNSDEVRFEDLKPILMRFEENLRQTGPKSALAFVAEESRKSAHSGMKEALVSVGQVAAQLVIRKQKIERSLEELVGQNLGFKTVMGRREGILRQVNENGIRLGVQIKINGEVRGETGVDIPWSEFKGSALDTYAEGWLIEAAKKSKDEELAASRMWIAIVQGDWDLAGKEVNAVGHNPFGRYLSDRLLEIRKNQDEADAQAAWSRLVAKYPPGNLTADRARLVRSEVLQFQKEYHATAIARELNSGANAELLKRIDELLSVTKGLVAHWSFNEGSGSKAGDLGVSGNHGKIEKAVWEKGSRGSSLRFTGSEFVSVPTHEALNPKDGITVCAWIRPDSWADGNRRILQKGKEDRQYRLTGEEGLLKFQVFSRGVVESRLPDIGKWSHVAGTFDGKRVRLFVNGREVGLFKFGENDQPEGKMPLTMDALFIGTKGDDAPELDFFKGSLDEVRIYDRALKLDEIKVLASAP